MREEGGERCVKNRQSASVREGRTGRGGLGAGARAGGTKVQRKQLEVCRRSQVRRSAVEDLEGGKGWQARGEGRAEVRA